MTDVSFVIPCYNEEGNVAAIFDAIHAVFDPEGISVETVFVNDGSKDGKKEALDRLYKSCSRKANIRVIHFSRKKIHFFNPFSIFIRIMIIERYLRYQRYRTIKKE